MKDEKKHKAKANPSQENESNPMPPLEVTQKLILPEQNQQNKGASLPETSQGAPSQAAQKILERLKKTAMMRQVSERDDFVRNQTASLSRVSPRSLGDTQARKSPKNVVLEKRAEKRNEDTRIAMDYTKILESQHETLAEKPGIKLQALEHGQSTKYPIFLGSVLLLLILLVAVVSILDSEVQRVRRTPLKEKPFAKPAEIAPIPTSVEKTKAPFLTPKEETLEEKMLQRDLVAWGDFWISKKEKEILREICPVGSRPELWPLTPRSLQIGYKVLDKSISLRLTGLFDLPKGISLAFSLQWLSSDKEIVYSKRNGKTDSFGAFESTFLLAAPSTLAWEGLYCFCLRLNPEEQTPFVRYFLRLDAPKTWELPFVMGETKALENQYAQIRQQYEACLQVLQGQAKTISILFNQKKKLPPNETEKQNALLSQEFASLQARIQAMEQNSFVAAYRDSKKKILVVCQKYSELLALWQSWQNSFDLAPPYFLEMETHFHLLYEGALLSLIKENAALLKALENKALLRVGKF